jgi:alanine-synthesizing transaminase
MFSQTASQLRSGTNRLYALRDELIHRGYRITDLVAGNVSEHGLRFPRALLEATLIDASRSSEAYRPDPLGQPAAREAVCRYYAAQGISIPAANVLLTPGTSISYWYCFKLLANEGEEILCPRPTYPLFDYIARLSGVRLAYYPLDEPAGWAIDIDRLESQISTATRAVVLISPHNPTGHVADVEEIRGLAEVARRHNLALIADEVFSEFLAGENPLPRPAAADAPLVFTLNGFSKMFALPGIKFGWIAITGNPGRVREATEALELISDTFLPVSEITQAAAPEIFRKGAPFREFYRGEIRARREAAEQALGHLPGCEFISPGGGFYVTLRLVGLDEEEVSETLLREHRLLLHPGWFYDMDPHHLVIAFVHGRDEMPRHIAQIAEALSKLRSRAE